MDFPIIDLASPTDLAFESGWLLATLATQVGQLVPGSHPTGRATT